MRSYKSKIVIALITIFLLITIGITWWYFANKKQTESPQTTQKRQQAEKVLVGVLNNEVGGYNEQDGFAISYMETEQIFAITITKDPFEKYKANALAWIKSKGLDPQNTHYICFVSQGVTVSDDQINRCGTANIN